MDATPDLPAPRCETAEDAAVVEALFDAAFGPGRFAKPSYRVRERTAPAPELSVVIEQDGRIVGAARQGRVRIGAVGGTFLGPFAVADDRRRRGLGPRLIEAAAERARSDGAAFVLLVGPRGYFQPLGFTTPPPGSISLGTSVDPARLQLRMLAEGPLPTGAVTPA